MFSKIIHGLVVIISSHTHLLPSNIPLLHINMAFDIWGPYKARVAMLAAVCSGHWAPVSSEDVDQSCGTTSHGRSIGCQADAPVVQMLGSTRPSRRLRTRPFARSFRWVAMILFFCWLESPLYILLSMLTENSKIIWSWDYWVPFLIISFPQGSKTKPCRYTLSVLLWPQLVAQEDLGIYCLYNAMEHSLTYR